MVKIKDTGPSLRLPCLLSIHPSEIIQLDMTGGPHIFIWTPRPASQKSNRSSSNLLQADWTNGLTRTSTASSLVRRWCESPYGGVLLKQAPDECPRPEHGMKSTEWLHLGPEIYAERRSWMQPVCPLLLLPSSSCTSLRSSPTCWTVGDGGR